MKTGKVEEKREGGSRGDKEKEERLGARKE
jgi:hypothetical protein